MEFLVLGSNSWKPFNCWETIALILCKQISSNLFKNEITYKLFTYKSYGYQFNIFLNRIICIT